MAYAILVQPAYWHLEYAGNCLPMAQKTVGAPGGPHSATAAANATQFQHHDRALPGDAPAAVWLSHWGTYTDYRTGQLSYEDWGHVVMWEPTAFGGAGGFFSSRRNGYGEGEWFRTIEDIELNFAASYRFWSEDINGVRVIQPAPPPAPPAPPPEWEDTLYNFEGQSTRATPQVIQSGSPQTLTYNDTGSNDRTICRGPGDMVSCFVQIRLKGKPGARVEFRLVREIGHNKERVTLSEERRTFDTLGMASVTLPLAAWLDAGQLVRAVVHVQNGQGTATVERFQWSGYARS